MLNLFTENINIMVVFDKSSKVSLPHLDNTSLTTRWHLVSTVELPESDD